MAGPTCSTQSNAQWRMRRWTMNPLRKKIDSVFLPVTLRFESKMGLQWRSSSLSSASQWKTSPSIGMLTYDTSKEGLKQTPRKREKH